MTVKEYAEAMNITLDEAKKLTGCTHWKQNVPEMTVDAPAAFDDTEEVVVKEVVREAVKEVIKPAKKRKSKMPSTDQIIRDATLMRQCLGDTDRKVLMHVSAYRHLLPEMYEELKDNIEIWL